MGLSNHQVGVEITWIQDPMSSPHSYDQDLTSKVAYNKTFTHLIFIGKTI